MKPETRQGSDEKDLTPRTRFIRHALFQPVDRVPYFETLGIWPQAVDRWHAEGLPRHVRHKSERDTFTAGQITVEAYFEIENYSWPPFGPSGTETPFWPPFEREVLQEDEATVIFRDPSGVVRKDVKQGRSMPQFLEFPVRERADWQRVKPRLDPTVEERYEDARLAAAGGFNRRDELVPYVVCGAYGMPRNLFGEESLAYVYYDDPALLHEIMAHWLAFYTEHARRLSAIVELDYVFLWEDLAFRNGPLVGPALAREFMFPYLRELIQELRGMGFVLFNLDSDGDPKVLLDDFIAAGINHFEPCEIAAGMEPQWVRDRYGGRCSIQGGIDKRALARGRAAIEREVMRKVPELLRGGGYSPGVDHGVPSDVALEDFAWFLELVRELCREVKPET